MTRTEALLLSAKLAAAGGKLYGEKVAIIKDDAETMSAGGIHIPDVSQRKPLRGRLVMIGLGIRESQEKDGSKSQWAGMAVGDLLTFSKYDGTLIAIPLPEETIDVEVMHGFDVYIGFGRERNENVPSSVPGD